MAPLPGQGDESIRVGIDVGGTNTDAVLLLGKQVVAFHKSPTTSDIRTGVVAAVRELLCAHETNPGEIRAVSIGTTQFTNAIVQRQHLASVYALRLGHPASTSLSPFVDWPADLVDIVGGHHSIARGGCEIDGRIGTVVDEGEIRRIAREIRRLGLKAVAISGVFSTIKGELEVQAGQIIHEEIPDAHITLSSEIGRIGLLERENAAIMNAALSSLAPRVVRSFKSALRGLGIDAPIYVSQNDGTLLSGRYVEKYPVLTFASGPTNSMRGAAFLARLPNAIVVDIGGTTTDIGVVTNSFPRESAIAADISGIRTNFRMPDVLSLGLGGGSIVRHGAAERIGPESVGYELTRRALVFGGDTLTMTDIMVAHGVADIGEARRVTHLDPDLVRRVMERAKAAIEDGIDRMRTSAANVPVVLVGGGAAMVRGALRGVSQIVIPEMAPVANAIGAALAQVSGEIDRIISYSETAREEALANLKREAMCKAVAAGAHPGTISVCEVDETPMSYLPGKSVRVKIKAVGDLIL
jgi:N-methylhydantoinase A/oxoprolinase/acetone carboxylase beta subunit